MALLAARGTARRAGESLPRTLGLGVPHPAHLLAAPLLAPGLAVAMSKLVDLLQHWLPLPVRMVESGELLGELEALSPLGLFLLLALTPGVCEELLFRGALLSGMRRDLRPLQVVLWQAVLFGAAHASIYRFLPTAAVGGVLAALTLRTRVLWPAVLLHTTYNAILVLAEEPGSNGSATRASGGWRFPGCSSCSPAGAGEPQAPGPSSRLASLAVAR